MALDVYNGQEMSPNSKHHGQPVLVWAISVHQPENTSSSATQRRKLYICSNAETALKQRTITVQVTFLCCSDWPFETARVADVWRDFDLERSAIDKTQQASSA